MIRAIKCMFMCGLKEGGELDLLDFSQFEALALVLLFFRNDMKVNMLKNKCRK